MAPAETYDPHFFVVAQDIHTLPEDDPEFCRRLEYVRREQTKAERIGILRKHPALSCRLFILKQHGIWEHIIMGKAKELEEKRISTARDLSYPRTFGSPK